MKPSPHLSYVIGVLRGDGYIRTPKGKRTKYGLCLSSIDYDFIQKFDKEICKVFEKTQLYPIYVSKRQRANRKPQYYMEAISKNFVLWYQAKSFEEINEFVEIYPQDYLRGLFDSEGSIIAHPAKRSNRKTWTFYCKLYFTNTSEELIGHVGDVLEKVGIPVTCIVKTHEKNSRAKFPEGEYKATKACYQMVMTRKVAILNFCNKIGFSIARKQKKLQEIVDIIGRFGFSHEAALYALTQTHRVI